jgi:glycosyltransferase involved in cell wall biosynthesis
VRTVTVAEDSILTEKKRLSARSKWRFGWQAAREVIRWRPDLIICAHLALGPVGRLLATVGRRPYWIVVHGIEAWVPLPMAKRIALRHADRVIVSSLLNRELVTNRQRIKPDRIASLPCTVDECLTAVQPARTGPHQALTDGQQVVLTVARMDASEQYKGHDVVLRALPSVLTCVPNLAYVIVGDGDDRSRIEALTDGLGLRPHVIFTGRVSDAELVALYKRCDVFALPARTVLTDHQTKGEGFGIVFLEAMAFGKPVIGPNSGAPAEVIRDQHQGLLVNPEDSKEVAGALVELLTNPGKARAMGQAGSDWVRQRYSYASFRDGLGEMLVDQVPQRQSSLSPNPQCTVLKASTLWEALFVLWVIVVNILYFAQFKALILARLGQLIHRWR